MKKIILIITLITSTYCLNGQSFTGLITYEQNFKSKEPQEVSDEMLKMYMGQTHEYFIKGGNYLTKTNGLGFNRQLYLLDSLKMFMYNSNSDTVFQHSIQKDTSEFISYEFFDTDKEILGFKVKGLKFTTSQAVTTYYYSEQLRLDWEKFSQHKFSHWNKATELMKSVPLGYLIDNKVMTIEGIAIDMKEMEQMSDFFKLPENSVVVKNPYIE
jgi:hypothetical protein